MRRGPTAPAGPIPILGIPTPCPSLSFPTSLIGNPKECPLPLSGRVDFLTVSCRFAKIFFPHEFSIRYAASIPGERIPR